MKKKFETLYAIAKNVVATSMSEAEFDVFRKRSAELFAEAWERLGDENSELVIEHFNELMNNVATYQEEA